MSEIHLKNLHFKYNACDPFTKQKEIIQKFKKQEIQDIIPKKN